jgi:Reverse transcriptase (RNA-dependent DNA polymerase).
MMKQYATSMAFLSSSLKDMELREPRTLKEAQRLPHWEEWRRAMTLEYDSLMTNQTWTLVPRPLHRKSLSGKWVYKLKTGPSGEILKHKARWVVRGFEQQEGIDYTETFASVVKPMSYRALFTIAAALDLEIEQMDVKSAFLYGEIEDEVYLEQPPGFENESRKDWVCKLDKALYGLKQSPRIWYNTLASFLLDLGFTPLTADSGIFSKNNTFIAVYVDDLLILGPSTDEISKLKQQLSKRFEMTDLGPCKYYLGMTIRRQRSTKTLHLGQRAYIEKVLRDFDMWECKPVATPMDTTTRIQPSPADYVAEPETKQWYARAIGSLMYAMLGTRPDIAFSVFFLSRHLANPTAAHVQAVKRVMRYLKGTIDFELAFKNPIGPLQGYSDADWAGDLDSRKSTTGFIFNLGSGAISWKSKKQPSVALSSCEAEYMAQTQATREAIWLRRLLQELQGTTKTGELPTTVIFGDNQGAIALTKNPEHHERSKHISIQWHFTREKVEEGLVDIRYTPTSKQVADGLTKALPRGPFETFRKALGLEPKLAAES